MRYVGTMMNDKRNDDKIFLGNLKGIAEISVNITLILCAICMAYLCFYKDSFIENMISDALNAAETHKITCPKEGSSNSLQQENTNAQISKNLHRMQ